MSGSLALTHTRTDILGAVATWAQRRTMLRIFVVPLSARLHQGCWLCLIRELPGLVAAPTGVRGVSSLGPKSSPGALHRWFVCNECMPVMSSIGLQSPAWVAGLLPHATCSSPHDHFDGIRDVSLALSQLWLLAEAMFLQSLKSFGFRASLSFPDVFDTLLPSVNKTKLPPMHFVCLFFLGSQPVLFRGH